MPQEENEDEDVKAERLRVKEILSSPRSEEVKPCLPKPHVCSCPDVAGICSHSPLPCQMPAILVSSLHKEFDERKEFLLGRKIKKVATKHVSLCVKKGWSSAALLLSCFIYKSSSWSHLSELVGNVCAVLFQEKSWVCWDPMELGKAH